MHFDFFDWDVQEMHRGSERRQELGLSSFARLLHGLLLEVFEMPELLEILCVQAKIIDTVMIKLGGN